MGRARRGALAAAAIACLALVCGLPSAAPAQAQADRLPLRLTVTVVPPSGVPGPRPAGSVRVAVDGRPLLSVALARGLAPLTSITPQLTVALEALGHRVTIGYSGDSNYEASTGLIVTLPHSQPADDRRAAQGHGGAGDRHPLAGRRGALRARCADRGELRV